MSAKKSRHSNTFDHSEKSFKGIWFLSASYLQLRCQECPWMFTFGWMTASSASTCMFQATPLPLPTWCSWSPREQASTSAKTQTSSWGTHERENSTQGTTRRFEAISLSSSAFWKTNWQTSGKETDRQGKISLLVDFMVKSLLPQRHPTWCRHGLGGLSTRRTAHSPAQKTLIFGWGMEGSTVHWKLDGISMQSYCREPSLLSQLALKARRLAVGDRE